MTRTRTVVLGALAGLVGAGLLAAGRTPYPLERRLGRWVHDWPEALTAPLELIQETGTRLAIVLVAAGLVVAGRYRAAGAAALAGFGAWLVATGLKELLDRPRPTAATLGRVPREVADAAAWPSGHATIAVALATVLALTLARDRISRAVVLAAAGLTAVARVHLGAHWGLDVLGGAALGILAGYLAVLALEPT